MGDSYLQLIVVLLIFMAVLSITALTTKWIAGFQKQQSMNCNIEVIETTRISNNKYIQLVRIGETYKAIAVCKDTVTLLGEVSKEQIVEMNDGNDGVHFKELLDKVLRKESKDDSGNAIEPKE